MGARGDGGDGGKGGWEDVVLGGEEGGGDEGSGVCLVGVMGLKGKGGNSRPVQARHLGQAIDNLAGLGPLKTRGIAFRLGV